MLALAGVGTAALLVASTASAWDVSSIPNGYAVITDSGHAGCAGIFYTINNNAIGCSADSDFGAALNTFIDNTICTVNPSADPQRCAPTTTTATTTTTIADPVTTTAPPATQPPPVGTTTITQTVTTPTETTTVGVTTTVSIVEQSLQQQIDALAAQLAQLTDRVTRLEKAGDASWLAFQQAVAGGADAATAADQARGTWLNVVNQLGAFASI